MIIFIKIFIFRILKGLKIEMANEEPVRTKLLGQGKF